MPLKSMEITKSDIKQKEKEREVMVSEDMPKYPYGLTLHLDEDVISKLEIDKLPEAGEKKMLLASVEITNSGQEDSVKGKKRRSLVLQITDMTLEDIKEKKSMANKMYGDSKES